MPVEKSAGGVVFYLRPDKTIEYLFLKHQAGHWSFPKGLIEKGETEEETAKREIKEETGLDKLSLIPNFRELDKFFFRVKYDYQLSRGWKKGDWVFKAVIYLLFRSRTKKVRISFEHSDYCWLRYEEAVKKITFVSARKVLEKANEFILKQAI